MNALVTIRTITTKGGEQRLRVRSPYHPGFPEPARLLGGKWRAVEAEWSFDTRDEARVRELCLRIYGEDGRTPPRRVSVQLAIDLLGSSDELWLLGRQLCCRAGRDFPVRLGEGVVLLSGGFPQSGGSRNNPRLAARENTVLEVRGVPEPLARAAAQQCPEAILSIELQDLPPEPNAAPPVPPPPPAPAPTAPAVLRLPPVPPKPKAAR